MLSPASKGFAYLLCFRLRARCGHAPAYVGRAHEGIIASILIPPPPKTSRVTGGGGSPLAKCHALQRCERCRHVRLEERLHYLYLISYHLSGSALCTPGSAEVQHQRDPSHLFESVSRPHFCRKAPPDNIGYTTSSTHRDVGR